MENKCYHCGAPLVDQSSVVERDGKTSDISFLPVGQGKYDLVNLDSLAILPVMHPQIVSLQKDAQRDFLTTLGSVAAAFLALYFTAMSVVISTAYARTPGR